MRRLRQAAAQIMLVVSLLAFFASPVFSAHTLDTFTRNPSTANSSSATNPLDTSYTCGAGTTVLILGIVHGTSTNRTGGAPTYNGVALTQASTTQKAVTTPEVSSEVWYLLSPPTGSAYTLSVPNAGGQAQKLYIASFKAQNGYNSALDVANGCNATATNPTCSVTTTVNGDVIFANIGNGAQTWNGTPNQTGLYAGEDLGAYGGSAQYMLQGSFGTQAMSWTFATTEDYGIVVVAIKEVASSGATINLSGQGMTASLTSPSVTGTVSATITLSGQGMAASLGDLTVAGDRSDSIAIAGQGMTAGLGTLTVDGGGPRDETINLSGQGMTASLGGVVVLASAALAIAGQGTVASLGTVSVSDGSASGQQVLQGGGLGDGQSLMGW